MAQVRLHRDCRKAYDALRPPQRKGIASWTERLRDDLTAGDQIPRSRIPRSLQRKYRLTNLWRIPLPEGWRALYTLDATPDGAYAILLAILDHKQYDRLFGYRTS